MTLGRDVPETDLLRDFDDYSRCGSVIRRAVAVEKTAEVR